MSHTEDDFIRGPAHLTLKAHADDGSAGTAGIATPVRLMMQGQGTIGFAIARKAAFSVTIDSRDWNGPSLRWDIGFEFATLSEEIEGNWIELIAEPGLGLDADPKCQYWFSFDAINRLLRYGKGEMRKGCSLVEQFLGARPPHGQEDRYGWLYSAKDVAVTAAVGDAMDIWRDPVTVEPALRVVPHDRITMDDMAANHVTVPANLTPTCQILYDNVAGDAFILDTPDFPDFAAAIKRSIGDPEGWCYKTLAAKASEFGTSDPRKTYLRITLGQNQGDSPGVPFVMEIWPCKNYSPIHDHGGAEAVIKVLHGAITVHMYSMLSGDHQQSFAVQTFETGDVTWISSRLNQVHKLVNDSTDEPCITIQCYLYAESNETHWPYFDYLDGTKIALFDPNSDADYLTFKTMMINEWEARDPLT